MGNIFQSPWLLIGLAVVGAVVLEAVRQIEGDRVRRVFFLVPVFIAATGVVLDLAVETDHESINAVIKAGKKAVIEQDCEKIESLLWDNYGDMLHRDRTEFVERCRRILDRPVAEKIKRQFCNIEIEGVKATSDCKFAVHLDRSGVYSQGPGIVFVKMQFGFIKTQGHGWKISTADLLEVNNQKFNWSDVY